jgi:hypothetical protein
MNDAMIRIDIPKMDFKLEGKIIKPLQVYPINEKFILAVYQGKFSKLDMLLKYRQKIKKNGIDRWSSIRTPKHIHWAVDILIKMNQDKRLVEEFLEFLIQTWNSKNQHHSEKQRAEEIKPESLLPKTEEESKNFYELNKYGEYSIKFLILLAKLLMQQEKNNMRDAYFFKNLLEELREGKDLFRIISTASHTGRKKY